MNRKEWLLIFFPLILVWVIDHYSKLWAIELNETISIGMIQVSLHYNQGTILGLFADLPSFLRVVSLSTGGAFLVVTYALVQYLLPIKSLLLRSGMSILLGGIIGNVTDRVIWGRVADFISIQFTQNFSTPIFNCADVFQWLGLVLIFWVVIKDGDKLWMEKNQRKEYWINPTFQLKYCYVLLAVGVSISLIVTVFSYTYLRVTLIEIVGENPHILNKFLAPLVITLVIISVGFCIGLFTVGKIISHKIAGPVYAFEKYVAELTEARQNGSDIRNFKLRSGDEFIELEAIAIIFKNSLMPEASEPTSQDIPSKNL